MTLRHHSTTTTEEAPVREVVITEEATTGTVGDTDIMASSRPLDPRPVRGDAYVPEASFGLIFGAFLAFLIAAWAAIVPFIGPTFGFSADGSPSWTWNEVHALGALVPGALGALVCLGVMSNARRPVAGGLGIAGFTLFLCGAWLAVVPVAWPVMVGAYFHVATPSITLAYWMGYASGPGVLLAAFGGIVMGRASGWSSTKRLMLA